MYYPLRRLLRTRVRLASMILTTNITRVWAWWRRVTKTLSSQVLLLMTMLKWWWRLSWSDWCNGLLGLNATARVISRNYDDDDDDDDETSASLVEEIGTPGGNHGSTARKWYPIIKLIIIIVTVIMIIISMAYMWIQYMNGKQGI